MTLNTRTLNMTTEHISLNCKNNHNDTHHDATLSTTNFPSILNVVMASVVLLSVLVPMKTPHNTLVVSNLVKENSVNSFFLPYCL
jgi:hypothetical protein